MIYILCPANIASGGPELLHQLGYKLRLFGFETYMFYYDIEGYREYICPIPEQYLKYQVPYVDKMNDTSENIVIFPEPALNNIEIIKNALRVVWWLSVDNANYDDKIIKIIRENMSIVHFSQSQYATDFLLNTIKIAENRIYYLSDYINNEFLKALPDVRRDDVVLFNPKKGFDVTAVIIKMANATIKWQVLNGVTPKQMHEIMHNAKVYIDFGNHPGKDRMPREAAISGCCIVTNKAGAANNDADIMIPEQYKFSEQATVQDVLNTIYELIENYDERKNDYVDYVERTKNEFIEFEKDVLYIFEKLTNRELKIFSETETIAIIQQEVGQENYKEAFRMLIKYKNLNYPDNIILDILETNIRIGLGEYPEAEYCCKKGLRKDSDNYELLLLLAQICYLTTVSKDRCLEAIEYVNKALECSKGTQDEAYVSEICDIYLQELDEK